MGESVIFSPINKWIYFTKSACFFNIYDDMGLQKTFIDDDIFIYFSMTNKCQVQTLCSLVIVTLPRSHT